jgi:hypothetical protein
MKLVRPVALAAAVLLGGCGGGDSYAADVCGALDRWVQSVNGSLAELRQGTEDRDSVSQERRALLQHLEDVEEANAGLREDLGGTGTSPEQEQVVDRLVALVDEADRAVQRIRADVEALDTQRLQEFRETVGPLLGNRLGGIIRRVLGAPAEAGGDLGPAFEDEPACDEILLPAGTEGGGPA